MKALEVRRHSYTKEGDARGRGSSLSTEGVRLARKVGDSMGPFALVFATSRPRTLETALAMGFAVDDLIEVDPQLWDEATKELDIKSLRNDRDLAARYVSLAAGEGAVAELCRRQAAEWATMIEHIEDAEAALYVSHGGLIEPGLVGALPEGWDHQKWGQGFAQCEGVRVYWENGRFEDAEILRL